MHVNDSNIIQLINQCYKYHTNNIFFYPGQVVPSRTPLFLGCGISPAFFS